MTSSQYCKPRPSKIRGTVRLPALIDFEVKNEVVEHEEGRDIAGDECSEEYKWSPLDTGLRGFNVYVMLAECDCILSGLWDCSQRMEICHQFVMSCRALG